MTPAERAQLEAELATLRRKAEARRSQPGFAANVIEVDQRVAEIEAALAEGGA